MDKNKILNKLSTEIIRMDRNLDKDKLKLKLYTFFNNYEIKPFDEVSIRTSANKDLGGFKEFLLEKELSENTISEYIYSLKKFFIEFDTFDKKNVLKFKEILKNNFKPQTVNIRLTACLHYAEFNNIPMKLKYVKMRKKFSVENVINIREYNKLINYLDDVGSPYGFFIRILAKTGARINEALRFRVSDLKRGYVDLYTKGKERRILFPVALVEEIMGHYDDCEDDDFLLYNTRKDHIKGKTHLSSRGFADMLKKIAVRAGIDKEKVYAHSFRHLFAIEFLKRNPNVALLADILGHNDMKTTQLYVRLARNEQVEALNRVCNW